ncbi:hypothetical protein [Rhodovulum strictum]|uniref:Uncharacterized protein n=1 Tax=Rhodovulum strictum TaxID=58314 RepID=A0A844BJ08_9RHOB|nr:hypothetical protein [Rhodovulum strictum]MRH22438.1 hypothetical protein [Rhodovulum strictum]
MGRQIVLPYSEYRIANAFKPGIELSDNDIAEMWLRCIADCGDWKRRKNRTENLGEVLKKKPKPRCKIRRDLSHKDIVLLKAAWG